MSISGIICGLGNPGRQYALTRHNAGFMVIDRLMESAEKIPGEQVRLKKETLDHLLWEWTTRFPSGKWLLVKPMSFMNRSGAGLAKVYQQSMIHSSQLLVIHDEVDLPLGRLRIKSGGGLAGHKGLASIAQHLGTRDFVRLRFGVGRPESGIDLSRYVLDKFMPHEKELRDEVLARAVLTVRAFCHGGADNAREELSRFPSLLK